MEPQAGAAAIATPSRGLVEYTHWIYGLHCAVGADRALPPRTTIAVRFAFGLPSMVAVIMNYARRSEMRGTWLESHFRWQIRTFWYSWLWIFVTSILAVPLLIVLVGFVIAIVGYRAHRHVGHLSRRARLAGAARRPADADAGMRGRPRHSLVLRCWR